jgi:hypothetical protein
MGLIQARLSRELSQALMEPIFWSIQQYDPANDGEVIEES